MARAPRVADPAGALVGSGLNRQQWRIGSAGNLSRSQAPVLQLAHKKHWMGSPPHPTSTAPNGCAVADAATHSSGHNVTRLPCQCPIESATRGIARRFCNPRRDTQTTGGRCANAARREVRFADGTYFARSMYSPVRVSMRIRSPSSMNGGTRTLAPVSTIASFI